MGAGWHETERSLVRSSCCKLSTASMSQPTPPQHRHFFPPAHPHLPSCVVAGHAHVHGGGEGLAKDPRLHRLQHIHLRQPLAPASAPLLPPQLLHFGDPGEDLGIAQRVQEAVEERVG